jgi:hypothetical protein
MHGNFYSMIYKLGQTHGSSRGHQLNKSSNNKEVRRFSVVRSKQPITMSEVNVFMSLHLIMCQLSSIPTEHGIKNLE